MLDEAKHSIRKPKAIEDLVNHVATILGYIGYQTILRPMIK
jgi:hypothetical protein